MARKTLRGVAFDVDGTLLTSGNIVSARMREVCGELIQKGIWITIASARPPLSVRRIAEEIGAHGPLCALNGATVFSGDGAILHRHSLPEEAAANLISRFSDAPDVSLNVYSGNDWLVPGIDARIQGEIDIVGFPPTVKSDLSGISGIEKILLMADENLAISLADTLGREAEGLTVARSNPCYVEITPQGMDKRLGVEAAARQAGFALDELVACGDGENDITLLEHSGWGIAMGHGPAGLRAVAREVVGSNNDDSLPEALAALFLQRP